MLTDRAAHLECLLLEEGQCICKDIQGLHSLPIRCMKVRLNGQVLVVEKETHPCQTFSLQPK